MFARNVHCIALRLLLQQIRLYRAHPGALDLGTGSPQHSLCRATLHPHTYHYHIRSLSHTIHTHTSTIHLNLPTYPPTRLAPLSRSAGAEARAR